MGRTMALRLPLRASSWDLVVCNLLEELDAEFFHGHWMQTSKRQGSSWIFKP